MGAVHASASVLAVAASELALRVRASSWDGFSLSGSGSFKGSFRV